MDKVNPYGKITKNMVCGGGNNKSGCHGDSGGPYVCQNSMNNKFYLQGAVSWGNPQCEETKHYTVFARVGRYVDWIKRHINMDQSKFISENEM